jgi:hypothetical protein
MEVAIAIKPPYNLQYHSFDNKKINPNKSKITNKKIRINAKYK